MPNKPRQFEIGRIYHIIKRGVDGRKIFLSNQDYSRFILGLEFFNNDDPTHIWNIIKGEGAERCPTSLRERIENQRKNRDKPIVELMVFALMPNHFHLIIREIIERGISCFMQKLGGYSKYFNKQYNRRGNLFESTYKCIEIKDEAQLIAAFNYVHTNPVELIESLWKQQKVKNLNKAKDFLQNYDKSSYRDYIGIPTFPNVINRDFFLEFFGEEQGCKKSVEDWIEFKAEKYIQERLFAPKDFE